MTNESQTAWTADDIGLTPEELEGLYDSRTIWDVTTDRVVAVATCFYDAVSPDDMERTARLLVAVPTMIGALATTKKLLAELPQGVGGKLASRMLGDGFRLFLDISDCLDRVHAANADIPGPGKLQIGPALTLEDYEFNIVNRAIMRGGADGACVAFATCYYPSPTLGEMIANANVFAEAPTLANLVYRAESFLEANGYTDTGAWQTIQDARSVLRGATSAAEPMRCPQCGNDLQAVVISRYTQCRTVDPDTGEVGDYRDPGDAVGETIETWVECRTHCHPLPQYRYDEETERVVRVEVPA